MLDIFESISKKENRAQQLQHFHLLQNPRIEEADSCVSHVETIRRYEATSTALLIMSPVDYQSDQNRFVLLSEAIRDISYLRGVRERVRENGVEDTEHFWTLVKATAAEQDTAS